MSTLLTKAAFEQSRFRLIPDYVTLQEINLREVHVLKGLSYYKIMFWLMIEIGYCRNIAVHTCDQPFRFQNSGVYSILEISDLLCAVCQNIRKATSSRSLQDSGSARQ